MSREARPRYAGITRSKPPGDRGALPSWQHSRFAALGLIGLCAFLASCSGGAGTGESQPTVLESAPPLPEESPNETAVEEGGTDSADVSEDETEDAEPIPASSDGPAENWPEPEIPEEIYEPTEDGAEALIQYWFDARHHARITGDVESWAQVSHADCNVCSGMIQEIEEAYPRGWYVEDADEIEEAHITLVNGNRGTGLFVLNQTSHKAYFDGEIQSTNPSEDQAAFSVEIEFADGLWQARDFAPLVGDMSTER